MQITDGVRLMVMAEVINELKSFGHYHAVEQVGGCRQRLLDRIERREQDSGNILNHPRTQATDDKKGQVAATTTPLRGEVLGLQGGDQAEGASGTQRPQRVSGDLLSAHASELEWEEEERANGKVAHANT